MNDEVNKAFWVGLIVGGMSAIAGFLLGSVI